MRKVAAIEKEIESLDPEDLVSFRRWFQRFDQDTWDRQLEADEQAGRLDAFAEEALEAHKSGKSTEI